MEWNEFLRRSAWAQQLLEEKCVINVYREIAVETSETRRYYDLPHDNKWVTLIAYPRAPLFADTVEEAEANHRQMLELVKTTIVVPAEDPIVDSVEMKLVNDDGNNVYMPLAEIPEDLRMMYKLKYG